MLRRNFVRRLAECISRRHSLADQGITTLNDPARIVLTLFGVEIGVLDHDPVSDVIHKLLLRFW